MKLGKVIARRRKAMGLTSQESLAAEVGLHRTYIGAIERGERNISLENLVSISAALGLPLSRLLDEAEHSGVPERSHGASVREI
ncbi:hypothetical protein A3709_10285 [Halioglobus sp. HI00S01]|uniref:helix-turn-helix domain-containing protein n=1 Tax=Halioglobus sp. HI00S01 TaxID=1822214 RepID=UPI0007C2FBB6|nr:helix-turn-helix transcriptional regulator [Halioglobus sp. HI00S01]KZX53504.1 hypothetical protein A3709_10285 [Halioglobus sp. HI00S01]